jgi:UDP:flavonoid glycosyltransferase YjiC (YdhE family)
MLKASCALMRNLQDEGHEVLYACAQDKRRAVEAEGLAYHQLTTFALGHYPQRKQEEVVESWDLKGFDQMVRDFRPDLIIMDMEVHEYIIHSHSQGYPFILLSQWFPIWPSASSPSLKSLGIPGRGILGSSIGIKWSWWVLKAVRTWRNLLSAWKSKGMDRRSVLLYYAKKAGFPFDLIDHHGWPPPFHYSGLPIYTVNNQALDFPGHARALDHFLGPQIRENRYEEVPEDVEQRLTRLFSEKKGRIIYCSLSTMNAVSTAHVIHIIDAMRLRPDDQLLITLGKKTDLAMDDLPPNVHVFSWLPQLEVLKHADVSINHGGIHTINECIHFKVPMLIYSGGRHDQNGCAARVAFHEVGIIGDASDSPKKIDQRLQQLLTDPIYQSNLDRVHEAYRAYESDGVLIKELSAYL